MARKFKAPGKAYKGFGDKPAVQEPASETAPAPSSRRIWLATRLQMFNLVLFTFTALLGYVQYFGHGAPIERSLYVGIAFTVILVLYAWVIKRRKLGK